MVVFAAVLLFSWGALSGGFGAYALVAACQSESLFHAVQAGISLLIATVSVSTGFVIVVVGGLKGGVSTEPGRRVAELGNEDLGGARAPEHRSVERDGGES